MCIWVFTFWVHLVMLKWMLVSGGHGSILSSSSLVGDLGHGTKSLLKWTNDWLCLLEEASVKIPKALSQNWGTSTPQPYQDRSSPSQNLPRSFPMYPSSVCSYVSFIPSFNKVVNFVSLSSVSHITKFIKPKEGVMGPQIHSQFALDLQLTSEVGRSFVGSDAISR